MDTAKRVNHSIRTLERLLEAYRQAAGTPLARFLTTFYRQHRQMGARDRRLVSRLAYHYFRLGHAARQSVLSERLAMAEFLCSEESDIVQHLLPNLYPAIRVPLDEKIMLLEAQSGFRLDDVFPLADRLSGGIDRRAFVRSLFVQPDLFIRLRPGKADTVVAALEAAGIPIHRLDEQTAALPNGTRLDQVPGIDGCYEVQDYSSQRVGHFFQALPGEHWWDACAGSGGKSLLMLDQTPGVKLLVSDVRDHILQNLDTRFRRAGFRDYQRLHIDLTAPVAPLLGDRMFDGIILDVPCSGSGTWGRTPEMITVTGAADIARFAALQRQVAAAVVPHLKPGKPLIYITCSVFAQENEQVVADLQDRFPLRVDRIALLAGYPDRADSLFVARLIRTA